MATERDQEFLTVGEFHRWREDFREFQHALDRRLGEGFGGLNDRLDDLNGRTRRNAEDIAAVKAGGCAQVRRHTLVQREWKWPAGISAVLIALVEVLKVIGERLKGWL